MYKTLQINTDSRGISTLTLDRPEVHNAFDEAMIEELHQALRGLDGDAATRLVVLRANGKSFCAGADVRWMKRAAGFSEQENYDDAMAFAGMLATLDGLSKPTVAVIQGPTYGGGVGLVSCCDIAVAFDRALFSLSEVKLGLVPAVISPYVVRAIGGRAARRYFQSAERFNCEEALRIGLIHEIIESETGTDAILDALLQGGPLAQDISKRLIARVAYQPASKTLMEDTARTIAGVRASAEAQEGLSAFLEKRNSNWNRSTDS